ncbi:outer membrane protein [Bradyrhizobium iriomotense]|uniref:Outer membrane protein beta-barrel domain-containing protein n=1 Tax=Bradyrhizobium iriomotense TaxID=441950 RepID=A0ABQ6B4B1_9BRAD|nr:hypothetical protein [Bradyrhizobium iriomotense]GLR88294.1 hypothetical protein GCM10007857_50060 [Bradyrhizobium iriomotense]
MKKFVLAFTAIVAVTGAASAADLGARTYTKAPVAAPVANWTGCYVGAGGGGAMTNNDHNDTFPAGFVPPGGPNTTGGARGWFGTVQGGCDYQFAGTNWLVGGFADADFMDVRGDLGVGGSIPPLSTGSQKQDWQWAAGLRVGYLVLPQLLTYVSGGYTQAHWKDTTLTSFRGTSVTLPGATRGRLVHRHRRRIRPHRLPARPVLEDRVSLL